VAAFSACPADPFQVKEVVFPASPDNNRYRSFLRQQQGNGGADTFGAACYNDDLIF
jgi:hypothetical protein